MSVRFAILVILALVAVTHAATINLSWNTGVAGRVTNVQRGDTVIWTLDDGLPHSVTSNDGTTFNSGILSGGTFSFVTTANTPLGNIPYHCDVHPMMTGTLVVADTTTTSQAAATSTAPAPSQSRPAATSTAPAASQSRPAATSTAPAAASQSRPASQSRQPRPSSPLPAGTRVIDPRATARAANANCHAACSRTFVTCKVANRSRRNNICRRQKRTCTDKCPVLTPRAN